MSETRHSEMLIWVFITVLGLSVIGGQVVTTERQEAGSTVRTAYRMPVPRVIPPLVFALPDSAPAAGMVTAAETVSTVELFLEAIVQVESAGNPRCVGLAGERGLMQLKRAAWQEAAATIFEEPPSYDQAFDPELNRRVGQAYLARMQEFLLANRSAWRSDMRSLLAACYNAGPNRVEAAGFTIQRLSPNTQSYVERVSTLHDYYLANPASQLYAKNRADPRSGS